MRTSATEAEPNLQHGPTRTAASTVSTAAGQGVVFIVYLGSNIYLARLLSPGEFGLVAMVSSFLTFVEVLKDGGLSTATIQKEKISLQDISNLFWVNAGLGLVLTLGTLACAPVIAIFYNRPELAGIAAGLSSTFLLSSLTVQHRALLSRRLQFNSLTCVNVFSTLVGAATGIALALSAWGAWALVGMQVAAGAGELVAVWAATGWIPARPSLDRDTGSLLRLGGSVAVGRLFRKAERVAGTIIVGKVLGLTAVGVYSRGLALIVRPLDQFVAPFSAVLIPTLARLQDDPEKYRTTFFRAASIVGIVCFPAAGMCLALADPLARLILGAGWSGTGAVFAGFSLCFVTIPMGYLVTWPLLTHARGADISRLSSVSACVAVASSLIGAQFGIGAVAVAYSASSLLVVMPLQFWLVGREGPVKTRDLWAMFLRYAPLTLASALSTLIGAQLPSSESLALVVCSGCMGGLVGATIGVAASGGLRRDALYLARSFARMVC